MSVTQDPPVPFALKQMLTRHLTHKCAANETELVAQREALQHSLYDALGESGAFGIVDLDVNHNGLSLLSGCECFPDSVFNLAVVLNQYILRASCQGNAFQLYRTDDSACLPVVGN